MNHKFLQRISITEYLFYFLIILLPFEQLVTIKGASVVKWVGLIFFVCSLTDLTRFYKSIPRVFGFFLIYISIGVIVDLLRSPFTYSSLNEFIRPVLMAILMIESVYGLYNAVNHSDSLFWFTRTHNVGIVSGTYINPDHLAGLLDMAIPVSVGLFLYKGGLLRERYGRSTRGIISLLGSRKALWLWVLSLGVLVMVLAHIFTLSRMGHISVMAAFGIVFVLYGTKKLRLPVVVMIILLSLGTLWAMWEGMGAVIAKWGMLENSFQGRHEVWKGAFSLAANFPLFGTGLGTFRLAYSPYKASGFGATTYDHAHNDYVEMFADTGMIGSIPWIAFFCLFLFLVTRSWFRNDSFFAGTIGTGCIAAVIAALVHSLADFNLQIPANTAILFVVMGMTWRMTEIPHPARASSNKPTGRL